MFRILRNLSVFLAAVIMAAGLAVTGAEAKKLRIALAETPSDELAAFFVALDRAKKNGLEYEWTAFSDEELSVVRVFGTSEALS